MKKLHFVKGKLSIIGIVSISIMVFLALVFFASGSWFGFVFLFPGAVILCIKEGVYIDLKKKMYKSYLAIFWITPAQWKPIPEGTRIGIRILKLVSSRNLIVGGPAMALPTGSSASIETLELFLYLPQPARVVLATSDNITELYEKAQYLHQHTGFEIVVDDRIPEGKYLK